MQAFSYIRYRLIFLFLVMSMMACKTEKEKITRVGETPLFEVNDEVIYQSNLEKDKQKTGEQYISILHTNLFDAPVSQGDLRQLAEVRQSIGDKQMADELILNSFVNRPNVQIPSNAQMRADVEAFIVDTYKRFFLRLPDAYEIHELKAIIEGDSEITPEFLYQSFALSNEYKFY